MKFLMVFCVIAISRIECKLSEPSKNSSDLIESLHQVISIVSSRFAFIDIITPSNTKSIHFGHFKNEFLSKNFAAANSSILLLSQSTKITESHYRQNLINLVIIETIDDFDDIYNKIIRKIKRFSGFFIIVVLGSELREIDGIFQLLWKIRISDVVVISEGENSNVLIKSFFPFAPGKCNDTTPVLISTFKNGTFRREPGKLYSDKLKNLHKCHIRIAVSSIERPEVFVEKLPNGSYHLSGRGIRLAEAFAESLNFVINYTYIGPDGYLYENGTAGGAMKVVMNDGADLTVSSWWLKENRLKFFDASKSYFSVPLIFVIPPATDFTSFEKLISPFSINVWILIFLVSFIGYFVIFIVQFLSKSIQNFVFGTGVRHPYLNMCNGYIGGSQHVLPQRNFARFLLMNFIIYSMVIRTVYQGLYYEHMQSNRQRRRIETVDEMVRNDFMFPVYKGGEDLFDSSESMKKRCVRIYFGEHQYLIQIYASYIDSFL